MKKFTFDSDVQGNHVCKDVWKPAIGEILHAQQELDNEVDKFAVKVVRNNETVDHLLVRVLANFDVFNCTQRKKTGNSCAEEWGFLVGWCSVVRLK